MGVAEEVAPVVLVGGLICPCKVDVVTQSPRSSKYSDCSLVLAFGNGGGTIVDVDVDANMEEGVDVERKVFADGDNGSVPARTWESDSDWLI